MRRFMQTFVLAPQSPKKYYVHNDIFRYQDEVFHDNDTDTENLEETVGKYFLRESEKKKLCRTWEAVERIPHHMSSASGIFRRTV